MMMRKSRDGWMAEDNIDMPELGVGRRLQIHTCKGERGIYSAASVHKVEDGIMTFVIFGDYRRVMERDLKGRCTTKQVAEMHARSLDRLDAIKAEAIAFYQTKALKEAA